jgi:pilus assembly protein CpaC
MTAGPFFCKLVRFLALAGGLFAAGAAFAAQEPSETIKIMDGGGKSARTVTLSVNKAVIVELPVEARDVLVGNPDIVDAVVRTPRRTYLLGQKAGSTNAFFFDASGKQILSIEIDVHGDTGGLEGMLSKLMPNGRIKVDALNGSIVLSGSVPTAADADQARSIAVRYIGDESRVFSTLQIEGNEQVMLRVKVAELQRNIAKQLGINMQSAFHLGEVALTGSTINPFSLTGKALSDTVINGVFNKTTPTSKNINVSPTLQALERHGILRTLAEPNLTAISGENAQFLAGGEFPVPKSRDRDGNVTIEYKPFGVGLAFTPVVMSGGRISLHISTEVSELQQDGSFVSPSTFINTTDANGNPITSEVKGITIPALRVRRAETTVELPSGGSLVMAGLLQETTKQNIDAFPGLKELPVLGALFQSRDFQNNETELVVIVTPYLVGPTSESELKTPVDGFSNPTDFETIFFGRLNAVYGKGKQKGAGVPQARRFNGPVGFIVE